jgi:DNA-binding MarR family transcriptional regulator
MPSSSDAPEIGRAHGELTNLMRAGYYRTMEHVQRRLEQRGFGDVRPAHMMIFQHLRPEGSRVGELADRAHLTNQSVGYLVDYLERQGYVERRPDPSNRRATRVCLTERGWTEMAACAGILDELDAELARRIGPQRLEQLHELLVEFVAALQMSATQV